MYYLIIQRHPSLSSVSPVSDVSLLSAITVVTLYSEGALIHILEEEDSSGWVKVADKHGRKGLVPGSYIEILDNADADQSSSASQESGRYGQWESFHISVRILIRLEVRAIYDYAAQGSDELSLKRGELIELTAGPSGGQNFGEGWWEGKSPTSFMHVPGDFIHEVRCKLYRSKGNLPKQLCGFTARIRALLISYICFQVELA